MSSLLLNELIIVEVIGVLQRPTSVDFNVHVLDGRACLHQRLLNVSSQLL